MSDSVTDSIDAARPMLFQPFIIRGLTLKNRLVVPPMVAGLRFRKENQ